MFGRGEWGSVGGLISGAPVPSVPDLARMRRDRHVRLQAELERQGLDGVILLGTSAVSYATGAAVPGMDSARATLFRSVAVIVRGDEHPYLLTPFPGGAPPEFPVDRVLAAVHPDIDESADALARLVVDLFPPGTRVAIDELTHALSRALPGRELTGAAAVLGAAKLCKTPDELACIGTAQRLNEMAMSGVEPLVRPGARQTDLTARFLRRIHELGAAFNGIDPIWQVMAPSRGAGPWTTHGDIAFPTASSDRFLREGDVLWVDTGISYAGYMSDFGRTWIVGTEPRPTARQRAQFERWMAVTDAVREICKPGVSALELGRVAIAANGGTKPWIEHFYLAHGVGTDSAEMPMIGTDLGESFDERLILKAGMVLVLEPVIWDEGAAGYRSEEVLAVTDDGWMPLSDHHYRPFGEAA
ncbi:MAG: Xaa-Pro peptidase family protein [Acidimicrobiales bacterium]